MVALKAIPTIIRYGVKFYKIAKKDLDEWLSRGASHVKKPRGWGKARYIKK